MRKKFFLLIIVCLVMGAGVMAQTSTVSGTVFAEDNNEPIIGASVLVKGTTLGAVTDIEGKFTILNVPGTAKTVIVSFVGMQKVEAAIKPAMKVVLKSDSELLDEVMVVAYGTAKKSSYAGSASLVKADALKDIPTTSFENALNGKVAGLQLTNNSGQAGSAPAIRIRGIGSMNAGNEPLYVVDGVPVSSGNTTYKCEAWLDADEANAAAEVSETSETGVSGRSRSRGRAASAVKMTADTVRYIRWTEVISDGVVGVRRK